MASMIITSHQTVKPSSPTPLASKIHKLSFLDQITSPTYIPYIFFYKNDESKSMQHDEIARRLKQSLSEILTVFYPLAGTINHNSLVECNDRGAEFVEARVHARLQEFIQNPKMEELDQLLPADDIVHDDNAALMSVKTSFFDCGGFSVGVCLSHKVTDGASAVAFMNAWAATCRSEEEASRIIRPSLDILAHRFPPRDLRPSAGGYLVRITKEKMAMKRLVFEREKVEKLRKEASTGEIKNPSKVEVVSVFIGRCFIEATSKKTREKTTSFALALAVNMRPRAVPPIPDHTFGNCVTAAIILAEEDDGRDLLVSKLRAAVRAADGRHINDDNNDGGVNNSLTNQTRDMLRSGNGCFITSRLRFPVYEVDFGWGKPVWVGIATVPYMNAVLLMDNPSRDGVEAWINVPDENFFRIFQHNYNKLFA